MNNPNQLLEKLVSINSVYPHENKLSLYLEKYLIQMGFKVKKVKTNTNRYNLVATYGKAPSYLGFYGHMDTVPPHADYKRNPFAMWTEDNETIGRGLGVCDMKGGITAILHAGKYAVEKKIPLKIIFGVDEEDISQGAHDLVDSKLLNNISFLIVAETGQVKDITQDVSVCLGRKGRIVYEIEVKGKKAHAAESEKGINAITAASHLITALNTVAFKKHPMLGKTQLIVQKISASSDSFSIPDSCLLSVSALTSPFDSHNSLVAIIKKVSNKLNITISISQSKRKTPYGDSYEIDLKNPFYKTIKSKIFPNYKTTPIYTPSVADENVFANRLKIPVLTIGAIGGGDHTASEWVNLQSLEKVKKMYEQIVALGYSY
jgi:succinyl-diaminopimelate desuccinylase